MPKFKNLYSFSQFEVDSAFKTAKLSNKIYGLKLLQAPMLTTQKHGKLLIITPRATGKAHVRNLIRRQLKAIFYEHKLFTENLIFIILIYKPAAELTFIELTHFLINSCSTKKTT